MQTVQFFFWTDPWREGPRHSSRNQSGTHLFPPENSKSLTPPPAGVGHSGIRGKNDQKREKKKDKSFSFFLAPSAPGHFGSFFLLPRPPGPVNHQNQSITLKKPVTHTPNIVRNMQQSSSKYGMQKKMGKNGKKYVNYILIPLGLSTFPLERLIFFICSKNTTPKKM